MGKPPRPPKKEQLRREAAILLAQGQIDPGAPASWHEHLDGSAKKIFGAMTIAKFALERAGRARVSLAAGEVAVHATTTGAVFFTTTGARRSDTEPLELSAAVGDAKGPIEGLAIRIDPQPDGPSSYTITDRLGMITACIDSLTVDLVLGTPAIED